MNLPEKTTKKLLKLKIKSKTTKPKKIFKNYENKNKRVNPTKITKIKLPNYQNY